MPVHPLWTLALNNQLTVPPGYDGSRVYFSIEHDRLAAYDIVSGKQQWLVTARPLFEPVGDDSLVFIAEPDAIVARGAADGSVVWRIPLDEPLAVQPVWDNGWLIAAARSGKVLAWRASDGHLIWTADLGSAAHAPPALAGDRVYVPVDNGRIVALRVDTGTIVWERRVGGAPNDILALDERLYVGSTDTYFYCLMTKDGRIDWRWRTGGNVIGRAVADERHVYFVSLDNVLRSLDQRSGGQQWMRGMPVRPTAGAVKAGSTLVVAGVTSTLRAYNITDGTPVTDIEAPGDVAAPPHAFEQRGTGLPMLLVVGRDIVKGATAVLSVHSIDPVATQPIGPLPNAVMPAPTLPTQP